MAALWCYRVGFSSSAHFGAPGLLSPGGVEEAGDRLEGELRP